MSPLKNLEQVTLISVTSIDVDLAMNALIVSIEHCQFGSVKLLSPTRPADLPSSIEHISIPPIDFLGYSKFMIEELYKYVDTEFCLVIQADGFVINPSSWENQFFEYDYIGAPWPPMVGMNGNPMGRFVFDKNRVGNGGFSLRSKKLLDICSQIKFDQLNLPSKSEDLIICHYYYDDLVKAGIKFAPINIASKFSTEIIIAGISQGLSKSFGFHGKPWLSNAYLRKLATISKYKNRFLSLLTIPSVAQKIIPNKIGRVDPCPCGSGKRFKNCHGRKL